MTEEQMRQFALAKLDEARIYAEDYVMWRIYRTAAENDAAKARAREAKEQFHLIAATSGRTVQ